MTRRRWIADEVCQNTAALTGEHASHLSRVLRAQVGQEFDIATGDAVRHGTIISISDDRVEFALGVPLIVKPCAQLTVVLAIFKFDRMEWAIEKCTEIGVARIVPLIARRMTRIWPPRRPSVTNAGCVSYARLQNSQGAPRPQTFPLRSNSQI